MLYEIFSRFFVSVSLNIYVIPMHLCKYILCTMSLSESSFVGPHGGSDNGQPRIPLGRSARTSIYRVDSRFYHERKFENRFYGNFQFKDRIIWKKKFPTWHVHRLLSMTVVEFIDQRKYNNQKSNVLYYRNAIE